MANDLDRRAHELSAVWDRLLAGEPVNGADLDPEMIETVDKLLAMQSQESISDALEGSIWANVIAGTGELWRPESGTARTSSTLMDRFAPLMRYAGIVFAGMIGGFVAGIGSRLFMRLAGFLTVDQNQFRLTENDARVGEITLDGTMSLGALGAGAGVVTLLIYLAIRNRLPFEGWLRSSAYGVLLLLVFGYVIMDPSNPDYQLFGPTWLNVSTFSSLYLLMGFCCAQAYELGQHYGPRLNLAERAAIVRVPLILICMFLCAFGALMLLGSLFVGAPGLIVVAVAGLAWSINRYLVQGRVSSSWMPAAVRPWGVLVVPGILGFILTARGITEILMN